MRETVTCEAIRTEGRDAGLEKGREEQARRILLVQGTKRYGKPSAKVRKTIAAICDPIVFERPAIRLLDVDRWTDLRADL